MILSYFCLSCNPFCRYWAISRTLWREYKQIYDLGISCVMLLIIGAIIIFPHYILGLVRFFHVPSLYRMASHIPLSYIERYFMYSIVYWKAPCVWLCIRQDYYRFKLPCTLSISGDHTRIPYLLSPKIILFW